MKISSLKLLCGPALGISILSGCGATSLISTPVENIDNVPLKITELSESEKKSWGHADLTTDTIPGMSVNRAYRDIIGTKKGKKVIVAVIDSGMDLEHEDLDDVLWTNKKERPGNGKDDDNNGYVDDIHGYNFLGTSYNEQLEFARIVRLQLADSGTQMKAKTQLDSESSQAKQNKERYEQILQTVKGADAAMKKHLGKDEYSKEDIAAIKTEDQALQQQIGVLMQMYSFADSIPEVLEELKGGIDYFSEQLNYHLNAEFDGRKPVGDNPYDFNDRGYGNGNPQNMVKDESHGTHVAGIIGAERGNGIGMKGVANNVALMSLRAVPNGDEYDKDIALAIRYAVDNGAKVINASFGKSFSPNADWVYDAIKYAAENDVLIVHAAGNDGSDLDDPANPNFPNDQVNNGPEFADNVLTVGALDPKYGSEMVASYSNYGAINVDVFAPGSDIYSTQPGNKYEFSNGTSFAAPGVSGIAALIWSHYPKLSAAEVKKIIMSSGLKVKTSIIVSGDAANASNLDKISTSGRIANAYNALIMASQVAKGKIKV
ncbi:MAG: S8 family peptidase [Bacteroidota bacterium]